MTAVSVAAAGRSRLDVTLDDGHTAVQSTLVVARTAFIAIVALILIAPFERLQPIVRVPAQALSTVEAVLLAGIGLWLLACVRARVIPAWRTPITVPWLTCLMVAVLASVWSPVSVVNALHMTARHALALVVVLMAVSATGDARRRSHIIVVLTCSAVAASVLVILEFLAVPGVLAWLRAFRPSVSLVGTAVRAGGPFQYPTIASMYLEIAFACTLGLFVDAIDRRRRSQMLALAVAIGLIAEAIVLTFTRAGLVTAAISLVFVGGLRVRARGWDRAVLAVIFVAAVLAVEIGASRSIEVLRLRMTTEGLDAWFHASIDAPSPLALQTGARVRVPVRVTNTGRVTWNAGPDEPVRFSYHWTSADSDRVIVWEGERTNFPGAVTPGETVTLDAVVQAPPTAGEYRLVWDLEQVHRLWFSTEPGAALTTSQAVVTGPMLGTLPSPRTPVFPGSGARPGRFVLWRAAAGMVGERPILGVGPDNFRLAYGRYAGIAQADPRVHSNSLYVETLAGAGLAGAAAFLWLAWRVRHVLTRALRHPTPVTAGIVAAVLAVAIHGLIDTFSAFTGVYVAIGVVIGLAVSAAEGGDLYAHRV